MGRSNILFPAWNRGLVSPKALGRVDLDRTRLSAERFENFLAKTQGALTIRPGTKWFGSSLRDTGAEFLEFVASTDDVAMPELTGETMRIWLGDDAHELALLSRPKVDTTVSFTDTGWSNASTGGSFGSAATADDLIPAMRGATTNGVTITGSSQNTQEGVGGGEAPDRSVWQVGDDFTSTYWADTGEGSASSLPSWVNVDFGSVANAKSVGSYSLRAPDGAGQLDNMAKNWELLGSNFDTGTYASDTGKWTLEDARTNQTGWAASERRTFTLTDTGTPGPHRHWRIHITALDGDTELNLAEIEMFSASVATQAQFSSGHLTLNASSIGALAKATKRVIVSDTGTEHSLAIHVTRGPVRLRVGSTNGDDDYISETAIGTGYHNLAFTPLGNFWVSLQSDAVVNRTIGSIAIGDSGTVEIATPWDASNLSNVRYDQSADVVYVDCDGVKPHKIERRGTGRSWSAVEYAPDDGPFLPTASSTAKLSVSHFFGNTLMNSDIPFFRPGHDGALIRMFHEGQSGQWRLGALNAKTDAIQVTGISDTGAETGTSERTITISVTGTYTGTLTVERSFETSADDVGADLGYKSIPTNLGTPTDTGTFTRTITDQDDNSKVRYRVKMTAYTSGVAVVSITYKGGGTTGIARITDYQSNMQVGIEVLKRFSDTGTSENWQQGYWSGVRGYPTAVALHSGRLFHAQGGSVFGSVSDDYESFDETKEGDAGPIIRTLGSGPVDVIRYLVSLLRMIIGTSGAELTLRSSSLDEPVTPDNSSAGLFSTQGSANIRALRMDDRAIFVQRSEQRVFMVGASQGNVVSDYQAIELTLLVPDLMAAGVRSIAIQRQPDSRLHCVLADGTVGILTYEPAEEVVCWSTWTTEGFVEKAMVLPGVGEDAVYYHVRRTVNGSTRRFLEKWALESECQGDTGLTWLMDCAISYTDTGRTSTLVDIAPHLAGASGLVVWGSLDSGSTPHVDLSPDVDGVQTTYAVDTGGDIVLSGLTQGVHHAVAGIPYQSDWRSTKLAYAAQGGTAVAQVKRVAQLAFVLHKTHANGLFYGSDTGHLRPLPRKPVAGPADPDAIYEALDLGALPFPGNNSTDERLHLRAKSPRPATILGAVPSVQTNDRV